jgi:hypothetical protein
VWLGCQNEAAAAMANDESLKADSRRFEHCGKSMRARRVDHDSTSRNHAIDMAGFAASHSGT